MTGKIDDVVIVCGGHNGLVAAAYLARAGLSVTVPERRPELGGAAVSFQAFAGVDVRLSRYRNVCQCSGLQAGGEDPRGRALGPERALNRTILPLNVLAKD